MTCVWNGRMAALQAAGVPAQISWSQGLLKRDAWGIPKGAKNTTNAQKFVAYSTMAIPQARVSLGIPYGSVNNGSNEYIPRRAPEGPAERARHQVAARATTTTTGGSRTAHTVVTRFNKWLLG